MNDVLDATKLSAASRRLTRSFEASRLFFRKQLWIWPLAAAAVLGVVAVWVRHNVESTLRANIADDLEAILNANVTALEMWIEMQKAVARTIAQDPEVAALAARLQSTASEDADRRDLITSPLQEELRAALEPALREHDYEGFVLGDGQGTVLATEHDELIGRAVSPAYREFFAKVFAGETVVTRPFASIIPQADKHGELRVGLPTMFVAAPVRGPDDATIAVLAFRIDPATDFSRILATATIGRTGETYAFDADGLMLSQSRFDDALKEAGLIPDQPDASSVLILTLKDPGADLTRGARPAARRAGQPLTKMAAAAASGQNGADVDGYRDYRGVPVVGVWRWLPDQGFGVATELDLREAYQPLYVLRTAFWGLFALLAASAVAIFIFTLAMARLQRTARQAALEARRLGQYSLDEKIGAGGMGVVYKAHHAMLHRPTAVKLLDVDKVTDEAVQRFEREVQLTCQLTHPNTIAIYDYGRTPEGVFYYAMEYLDGLNLESLVERYGTQPDGRVIQILAQICGSLAEAHELGLIHRDIKPANILINHRGGVCDVVKVLDFGLVKSIEGAKQASLTDSNSMAGTPLYMAPEAIQSPSETGPRADLYAVGAVGYFLLTGTPVFRGGSVVEICMQQVNSAPEPPSQRSGRRISVDLEQLILACLAKNPNDRPATARQLADALLACHEAHAWTAEMAERWWQNHTPIGAGATTITVGEPTKASGEATTTLFQHESS